MLSIVNHYISLRIFLKLLIRDVTLVEKQERTDDESVRARRKGLLHRSPPDHNKDTNSESVAVGLDSLEEELLQLGVESAALASPPPAPARRKKCVEDVSVSGTTAAKESCRISNKVISDFSTDEIAIALLTKYQRIPATCR